MKKFLITLLLFANIFSGTAFAWDNHPAELSGHELATADLVADINYDHSNDTYSDDHCAHGAAHLVGIFYGASISIVGIAPNRYASVLAPFTSLYISPLLRPPIV